MRKINLIPLLCILVTCVVGCANRNDSTTVQDTVEKEVKVTEKDSVVSVEDILQTMNSLHNEMGVPQPREAMIKAGYKQDEVLKVSGVLTIDNMDLVVSYNAAILAIERSPQRLLSDQVFLLCVNETNEHILIPNGTEVVVEGNLKMDQNIQAGERIAVKGVVREEEQIFVRAGDAAYSFDR